MYAAEQSKINSIQQFHQATQHNTVPRSCQLLSSNCQTDWQLVQVSCYCPAAEDSVASQLPASANPSSLQDEAHHQQQYQQHDQYQTCSLPPKSHPQRQQKQRGLSFSGDNIAQSSSSSQVSCADKNIQRVKANRKERRRTQSINLAFNKLRRHIPNVPLDTKLSKIKTLRLAIGYIGHLRAALTADSELEAANITNKPEESSLKQATHLPSSNLLSSCQQLCSSARKTINSDTQQQQQQLDVTLLGDGNQQTKAPLKDIKNKKHRTGWPEMIWRAANNMKSTTDSSNLQQSK